MLIERLLNKEKTLTLVYDKTFYAEIRNINVNNILDLSG